MPTALRIVSIVSALAVAPSSLAAGLDEPWVGGLFGSPTATNASSVWWNPAGLAAARGTRFLVDVGPTFRRMTIDREGLPRPALEMFTDTSAVPFVGLASDFGIRRVGLGFALFVPQSQRWRSNLDSGPNRQAVRTIDLRVLQIGLGGAYEFGKVLSVGASAAILDSRLRWTYDVPVVAELAASTPEGTFDDAQLVDPAYAATTTLELDDQATVFGVGVMLQPLGDPRFGIALAYQHGARFDQQGTARLDFACPPESDAEARAVAEAQGTCDASVEGTGSVRFDLPSRLHAGVALRVVPALRLEAFGTWVRWSRLSEVRVGTQITSDAIDGENADATASQFTRERPWARDLRDTFRAVLDAKLAITPQFTLGMRAGWQQGAVPTRALSAVNADASRFRVAGLGLFRAFRALEIGVAYGRDFAATREVTDSAFALSLQPDRPVRYQYTEARGRYAFVAQRVGLVVKGNLGLGSPR